MHAASCAAAPCWILAKNSLIGQSAIRVVRDGHLEMTMAAEPSWLSIDISVPSRDWSGSVGVGSSEHCRHRAL